MQYNTPNNAKNHYVNKSYGDTRKILIPDKAQCSYWWRITMNPDQRVQQIVGYSKFQGFREPKSKEQTLCRCIMMLYQRGYMFRSSDIVFFERRGALCSEELDTIILQIQPSYISYHGESSDVQIFLDNFIKCVEKGIAPKVMFPLQKRPS